MRNIFIALAVAFTLPLCGQATLEKTVKSYFDDTYISDGQIYRVMLNYGEEGEFEATFFAGTKYRIAMSSTISNSSLVYSLIDNNRNVIFTNQDYDNTPYWDFEFTSTVDCKILVKIDNKEERSGIAIMMIGYKNPPK